MKPTAAPPLPQVVVIGAGFAGLAFIREFADDRRKSP
jgi:cation diffusion facilitator CzcD-associated flavoprotein CzcO